MIFELYYNIDTWNDGVCDPQLLTRQYNFEIDAVVRRVWDWNPIIIVMRISSDWNCDKVYTPVIPIYRSVADY